ncbi:replication endonuclease [Steroidobacter sp. S1-65]|uniref:Replication endonuclease n=1 Tax=Steroidobacter gossypii TaxID=2805490 RepID=A0ABS1WXE8_9GAMM|nr:replication endonuclease [Steroidobacter gossypii]MBM0105612.1 replication endonuclease [Steroidobacter gossypii]
MIEHARALGIEPPQARTHGEDGPMCSLVGVVRRLQDEYWWRRQMRRAYTRTAETHLRLLGVVHRQRQVYASDRAVIHRRKRNKRAEALLKELVAVSDAGDQLELWEVRQKSNANPEIRRAELMTRLRGFEEVAAVAGHVAEFVTLTCPSAYHRTHADGTPNERFAGFAPRDGQQWLCKMWARARAKLARLKILIYGFRVAEPHHDGTPHWHMVLFMKETNVATVRAVLGGHWLSEYRDEPGAKKHRAKFKRIDPHKGSACGYVAKYVSKNIDGFEVGEDYETSGETAAESCHRVGAWASAHGIRQFQQIGGPQVTVWRELRRLRDVVVPDAMGEARAAADAGEWSQFVVALGGIERGRKGNIQPWTEVTGEMNQYDELRGPQIAGVQSVAVRVRTRTKCWRIQRKAPAARGPGSWDSEMRSAGVVAAAPVPSLGPVSITVRESRGEDRWLMH